jgi:hypothetical protein
MLRATEKRKPDTAEKYRNKHSLTRTVLHVWTL